MGLKIWAYVVLAGILVTGITVAFSKTYQAGYNAAVVEAQEAAIIAQNKAQESLRVANDLARAAGEIGLQNEDEVSEGIRNVEKQIPDVVSDCIDLGPDFLRVFNAATNAGNRIQVDRPEPAAEPD